MDRKQVHVVGGGTVSHVRPHLALSAPAYGGTARKLAELCKAHDETMGVQLHLTKMADHTSRVETNDDLREFALALVDDPRTKIVFWNPAVVDFDGHVGNGVEKKRLRTTLPDGKTVGYYDMVITPTDKIVSILRQGSEGRTPRKDIFLVAFKATAGETAEEQYRQGLDMLKRVSANLVLANDVETGRNMIITPEEACYSDTFDRDAALRELVEMAYLRSHLTFTRSTVVAGEPVPWDSSLVPATLRTVVDYCIGKSAYKRVRGVTAGHFAVKLDEQTFLTSRRKTDFNDMKNVGLVKVKTDGPDSVIAYGSRPSVGGQSQRIVFKEHPDTDCIVHFHCPKKEGSPVPTVSQREYECGSHECGKNTSRGLTRFGNLYAVYLDHHGPNIVFSKDIDPQEVIDFIEEHFDLSLKTGGYQVAA
ncbi:MAG TPA: class II aldolase/adducin family protein [Candidatus Paceibacterota bacterium]|nr:class II aldolase/adducin family protein [Candidatus Paceibacterota bacterium]